MIPIAKITSYTSLIGFLIGLPTAIATYYQSFKTRQEARQERDGTLHSLNCIEFINEDGNCINLVPLETLHTLPKPGDVVLLPGDGVGNGGFHTSAYRIERVEHIYTQVDRQTKRPREARLTKAIAVVRSLHEIPDEKIVEQVIAN
jgi:hypothetical protein